VVLIGDRGLLTAALMMRDAIARLGNNITRERLREQMNTFTRWRPDIVHNSDNFPWYTFRPSCHLGLHGGYVIQIPEDVGRRLEVEADHAADPCRRVATG